MMVLTCYTDNAEPEWFTEDVSMTDTIELKGFEGHKEKIEKREKKEREKKERKEQKVCKTLFMPIEGRAAKYLKYGENMSWVCLDILVISRKSCLQP